MTRQRVFCGWWVTIAFAVMVFLSTGVRFAVGPFLKPIVTDLGTDRATYSLIVSLSLVLYGAFMPFVGRLVERWGARPVAVLGILELTGGYGAAFAIASVQLLIAAVVSLTINEAACGVARLRAAAAER